MSSRDRVRVPPVVQPAGLAPWGSAAVPSTAMQQQVPASTSTEVGQFEPLPDSPTGGRTAAGRSSFDQHPDSHQQQQAGQDDRKVAPLQEPTQHTQQKAVPAPATRGPPPGTAHVHLIGEITGAVGLGGGPLYCTWQLVYDARLWSIAGGLEKGRTHASGPLLSEDGSMSGVVWDYPLDILLATSTMQQWPSVVFKLFHRSIWLGRDEFVGYSLCSLPNTPGCHHVSCPVWVAAEGGRSLHKEVTQFFTGLHPQLVDESFITDMEQRFEQGQHLHTVACSTTTASSTHNAMPQARSMVCTGGPGAAAAAAGGSAALRRPHCASLSAASRGAAAVTGSGICLRLHVLTRGLEQLSRLRGDGVDSIGRCLERLHSNVGKMRRQHGRPKLQDLVGDSDDEDGQAEAAEESAGTQLVRQGRAARLQSVHQQLFGRDGDRDRDRDQKQLQQLQPTSRRLESSSPAAGAAAVGSPARVLAGGSGAVSSLRGSPGGGAAAGGSPGRLRSLANLAEAGGGGGDFGSSRSSQSQSQSQSPARRLGAGGAGQEAVGAAGPSPSFRPSAGGAEPSGGPGSSGSPLRRDAAGVSNRWAGRFASPGGQAAQESPTREELLPASQQRSYS